MNDIPNYGSGVHSIFWKHTSMNMAIAGEEDPIRTIDANKSCDSLQPPSEVIVLYERDSSLAENNQCLALASRTKGDSMKESTKPQRTAHRCLESCDTKDHQGTKNMSMGPNVLSSPSSLSIQAQLESLEEEQIVVPFENTTWSHETFRTRRARQLREYDDRYSGPPCPPCDSDIEEPSNTHQQGNDTTRSAFFLRRTENPGRSKERYVRHATLHSDDCDGESVIPIGAVAISSNGEMLHKQKAALPEHPRRSSSMIPGRKKWGQNCDDADIQVWIGLELGERRKSENVVLCKEESRCRVGVPLCIIFIALVIAIAVGIPYALDNDDPPLVDQQEFEIPTAAPSVRVVTNILGGAFSSNINSEDLQELHTGLP
jgi:hypothetical protein